MKLLSRNPDKPKKQLETTIGKIIYGFLLFMPLLSIMVTSAYAIFNKNAYQSYSDEYIYKEYIINNIADFNTEFNYTFTYKEGTTASYGAYLPIYYISLTATDLNLTQAQYDDIATYAIIAVNNEQRIYFKNSQDTTITYINLTNPLYKQFIFRAEIGERIFNIATITRVILAQNKLDNVFTYAIEKTEKTNLYNWAKNTGTYDVLHNTTTLLGIDNTFIPMLMAYWLLISVIYFIYDIALMLIMVVHRKIHELQESI